MEEFTDYAIGPRPDTHREQHDVHHAEPGDRERAQQHADLTIVAPRGDGFGDLAFETDPAECSDEVFGIEGQGVSDSDALGGQIDPRGFDAIEDQ